VLILSMQSILIKDNLHSFWDFVICQLSLILYCMLTFCFQSVMKKHDFRPVRCAGFCTGIIDTVTDMMVVCDVASTALSNCESGELSRTPWPPLCEHWYHMLKLSHKIAKCLEIIFQFLSLISRSKQKSRKG
jgi:hypothetical protein